MRLKSWIVFCLTTLVFTAAHAQDKIYKKDGDVVAAKVKEVSTRTIVYKRFDNQDGPEYTMNKNEVEKIVYQNGTQDVFSEGESVKERGHRSNGKTKYRNNILSLAPFQVTENGIGFGVSYERTLDKNGIVSLYLPVMITYNGNGPFDNQSNYGTGVQNKSEPFYYAMPGLKFYPTGNKGTVKYSVGPSLVVASGTKVSYYYDSFGNYQSTEDTRFILGIMVQNTLNINPTPRVYLACEFGFGASYLNQTNGQTDGLTGLVQFAFKVGYWF